MCAGGCEAVHAVLVEEVFGGSASCGYEEDGEWPVEGGDMDGCHALLEVAHVVEEEWRGIFAGAVADYEARLAAATPGGVEDGPGLVAAAHTLYRPDDGVLACAEGASEEGLEVAGDGEVGAAAVFWLDLCFSAWHGVAV